MEYELEEWSDEAEELRVTNLEAPIVVLNHRRWIEASAYAGRLTQSAELIPEESPEPPEVDLRAGLVRLDD